MTRLLFTLVVVLPIVGRAEEFQWQTDPPEKHGFSPQRLEAARQALAKHGTQALLVVRDDRIVLESYAADFPADKPHGTASLAKALVGGMSLAVAMNDGRLGLDDLASRFVPQWKPDPRKAKITVLHLATHSSGIEDAEQDGLPHTRLTGWKGDFWKRQPDPFTISRDNAPAIFEPGEKFHYSNPGMAMLAYAITRSIQGQPQADLRSLLGKRIYGPIGIGGREWSIGYGATYDVDGLKLVADWGGAAFTARATARIGRLMLRKGDWDGQRLLKAEVVEKCTSYAKNPIPDRRVSPAAPAPTPGWYSNFDGVWPEVPRDAFAGAGAQHQVMLVVPSLKLIIVRYGGSLAEDKTDRAFWPPVEKFLFNPIMEAMMGAPPSPGARSSAPGAAKAFAAPCAPSPIIRSVRLDPPETIRRFAPDSDNWPMTHAEDGHVYTSYGDGSGFEPKPSRKLSLGLARLEGDPPDVRGVNLPSPTAERTGNGRKGPKASGLLCVDKTLYMWVRNTGNSTLAWSADHGTTWTWGFTLDTSFGCPTFLNFGVNYAGARDQYVYTFSQDGPSAYEPYDGIVLARVRKDRLREKAACEFFEKLVATLPLTSACSRTRPARRICR